LSHRASRIEKADGRRKKEEGGRRKFMVVQSLLLSSFFLPCSATMQKRIVCMHALARDGVGP
jgi:hypothetical protein